MTVSTRTVTWDMGPRGIGMGEQQFSRGTRSRLILVASGHVERGD